MIKVFSILCVMVISVSALGQTAPRKRIKKTVTTTTVVEEVNEDGSLYKETPLQNSDNNSKREIEVQDDSGLPTENESWYTLWGLGFSSASYSGNLGDAYEADAKAAGSDRSGPMNMDLLGFYWPLEGHKTMMGFILNTTSDAITYASGSKATLSTSLLGFSAQHFFGKNIGHGFFVRGDVGLSRAAIDFVLGGTTYNETTDAALGVMVGGGYGFSLGKETRILLGLYLRPLPSMKFSNGAEIKGTVTNLTAGFLF